MDRSPPAKNRSTLIVADSPQQRASGMSTIRLKYSSVKPIVRPKPGNTLCCLICIRMVLLTPEIWSNVPPSLKCSRCARCQPPNTSSTVNIFTGLSQRAGVALGSMGR